MGANSGLEGADECQTDEGSAYAEGVGEGNVGLTGLSHLEAVPNAALLL